MINMYKAYMCVYIQKYGNDLNYPQRISYIFWVLIELSKETQRNN